MGKNKDPRRKRRGISEEHPYISPQAAGNKTPSDLPAKPHRRPQGYARCLQGLARRAAGAATDHEPPPRVAHRDLFQRLEIILETRPFRPPAASLHPPLELFQQHQGREAAKHMATNGLVTLVVLKLTDFAFCEPQTSVCADFRTPLRSQVGRDAARAKARGSLAHLQHREVVTSAKQSSYGV